MKRSNAAGRLAAALEKNWTIKQLPLDFDPQDRITAALKKKRFGVMLYTVSCTKSQDAMLALKCVKLNGEQFMLELPSGADVAALIRACFRKSGHAGHIQVLRAGGSLLEDTAEKLSVCFGDPGKRTRSPSTDERNNEKEVRRG